MVCCFSSQLHQATFCLVNIRRSGIDTMAHVPTTSQRCCELGSAMLMAQRDGELCDFELVCNGHSIRLHKVVVCLQSRVIKAACTGSFEEASGRYEMQDCDFDDVQRLVNFLYAGDYYWGETEQTHELAVHISMFALADKYLIDGLLKRATSYFQRAVRLEEDIRIVSQYTKIVYGLQFDSSKSLRDVLLEYFRQEVKYLAAKSDVQQSLEHLMGEVPEFAKDIAMSYIRQPCTDCVDRANTLPRRRFGAKSRRISEGT
ncbi:hypothetical protein V8C26DRAFT_323121 [Trichoderma gracile]